MNTTTLTFTRFIAASTVVVFHFGKITTLFNYNELTQTLFSNGYLAVSYFFYLSGFVLALSTGTIRYIPFMINRFSRILPLYLIALFLVAITMHYFWGMTIDKIDFFLNLFFLQAWFPKRALSLNYPGWSLSVEVFLYSVFPLILWIYQIIPKERYRLFLTTLVWTITQIISFKTRIVFFPLIFTSTFLVGVHFGLYTKSKNLPNLSNAMYNAILTVSVILLLLLLTVPNPIIKYCQNGFLAPLYVAITIGLINAKNKITTLFKTSACVLLGEISYGVYILQYPSLFLFRYMNDKLGLFSYSAQTELYYHFVFLILLSTLTYFAIEKPFKKLIRRYLTQYFVLKNIN